MKLHYSAGHLSRMKKTGFTKLAYNVISYLNMCSIARQAINRDIIDFIPGIKGDIVEIGGNTSLQDLHINGRYILLEIEDSPNNDITANAERLPFLSDSVQGFICLSVLEHTLNPSSVVNEIWRCLSPGGRAFISVPWLFEAHMEPRDFYRFSSSLLGHLFRNFQIIKLEPTNSYIGLLAHLLQKRASTRLLLGIWLFLLDLLLKPNFTWTTQINAFIEKPIDKREKNDFNVDRWPDNIRCPFCAPSGQGRLSHDTTWYKCNDCERIYPTIDKRIIFINHIERSE